MNWSTYEAEEIRQYFDTLYSCCQMTCRQSLELFDTLELGGIHVCHSGLFYVSERWKSSGDEIDQPKRHFGEK
jgi:hypothetical protein